MVRSFEKHTTNVGGSTGIIIPKEVLYAEGIQRGQRVRIIIESIKDASTIDSWAEIKENALSGVQSRVPGIFWRKSQNFAFGGVPGFSTGLGA